MKRRINKFLFLLGTSCLIAFIMAGYFISESRNIRLNGELINTPIVGFYGKLYRSNPGVYVKIDGKQLYSRGQNQNMHLGDTISVRYIKGKDRVIQEQYNLRIYTIYYVLNFILLISGILLIKESFKGKSIWKY